MFGEGNVLGPVVRIEGRYFAGGIYIRGIRICKSKERLWIDHRVVRLARAYLMQHEVWLLLLSLLFKGLLGELKSRAVLHQREILISRVPFSVFHFQSHSKAEVQRTIRCEK
jgi:hypothetical protein